MFSHGLKQCSWSLSWLEKFYQNSIYFLIGSEFWKKWSTFRPKWNYLLDGHASRRESFHFSKKFLFTFFFSKKAHSFVPVFWCSQAVDKAELNVRQCLWRVHKHVCVSVKISCWGSFLPECFPAVFFHVVFWTFTFKRCNKQSW